MITDDTDDVAQWLTERARSAALPQDGLAALLCAGMVADGIPLWRAAAFARAETVFKFPPHHVSLPIERASGA
jgi:hypothetical protein